MPSDSNPEKATKGKLDQAAAPIDASASLYADVAEALGPSDRSRSISSVRSAQLIREFSTDVYGSIVDSRLVKESRSQPTAAGKPVLRLIDEFYKSEDYQGSNGLKRLSYQLRQLQSGNRRGVGWSPSDVRFLDEAAGMVDTANTAMEKIEQSLKSGNSLQAVKQYIDYRVDVTDEGTPERQSAERAREFVNEQLSHPDFPSDAWGYETLSSLCAFKKGYLNRRGEVLQSEQYKPIVETLEHISIILGNSEPQRNSTGSPLATWITQQRERQGEDPLHPLTLDLVSLDEVHSHFDGTPASYRFLSHYLAQQAQYGVSADALGQGRSDCLDMARYAMEFASRLDSQRAARVLDRGRDVGRRGATTERFGSGPMELASAPVSADILGSEGGGYKIGARPENVHEPVVEDFRELDARLRRIIHESDCLPEQKTEALRVLQLAQNPANKGALEMVLEAGKGAGRFGRAEGGAASMGIVVLALATWYTKHKMAHTEESYIPEATVN